MQPQSLYHLLGIWLLLIQLPRGIPGHKDETVKICGRKSVHLAMDIYDKVNWKGTERELTYGSPSGTMADAETVNKMSASDNGLQDELDSTLYESYPSLRELQQPTLKNLNLNSEEKPSLKSNNPFKPNMTEYNKNDSVSELKNLVLAKDSPQNEAIP